jgi:hypothetical protein
VLSYADDESHVTDVQQALKSGGLVVFENFHADINHVRPSEGKPIGFATDELQHSYAAAGFQILHYEEPLGVADFSQETHRLVKLIAQKL